MLLGRCRGKQPPRDAPHALPWTRAHAWLAGAGQRLAARHWTSVAEDRQAAAVAVRHIDQVGNGVDKRLTGVSSDLRGDREVGRDEVPDLLRRVRIRHVERAKPLVVPGLIEQAPMTPRIEVRQVRRLLPGWADELACRRIELVVAPGHV